MPKFKNVSNDDRYVYGRIVKVGSTYEVSADEVEGFAGQDEIWEPVGTQAKHAVKEAIEDATESK